MIKIKNFGLTNGSITFMAKTEGRPETSEKHGNVTINNYAIPGIPSHYQATFLINVQSEINGVEINNAFHWTEAVTDHSDETAYRVIEDAAVRNLAPTFRAIADQIEQQIADFDKKRVEAQNLPTA